MELEPKVWPVRTGGIILGHVCGLGNNIMALAALCEIGKETIASSDNPQRYYDCVILVPANAMLV